MTRRQPPEGGRAAAVRVPASTVNVLLTQGQATFLERLAANIASRSRRRVTKSQLIRALLDGVGEADIDLTAATSEADLKATIVARLGRYRLGS